MVALLPLAARGRGGFSETFGWFHTVSQTPEYKWQLDEAWRHGSAAGKAADVTEDEEIEAEPTPVTDAAE